MQNSMHPPHIIKICLGGDGGTGKTSLLETQRTGIFQPSAKITIGIDFACFPMQYQNQKITFLVYDLAGQQRFRFLQNSFIIGSRAAIILYDLTRERTFQNIPLWYKLFTSEYAEMPILIAGSKMDLVQNADLVYYQEKWRNMRRNFPDLKNIIDHRFISAKNAIGIIDIFQILAKSLLIPSFTSQTVS